MNKIPRFAQSSREWEDGHRVDVQRDESAQHEEGSHHAGHAGHEGHRVQVPVVQQGSLNSSNNNEKYIVPPLRRFWVKN